MEAITPVDVLGLAEYYLDDAKKAHKRAKENAEDFLAAKREADGTTSIESKLFGGEFHYGKTRAKECAEYHVCDEDDFEDWIGANCYPLFGFLKARVETFAKEWFEETGEVPEGVSRVVYPEPARETPPKLYKFDVGNVKKALGIEQSFGEQLLGNPEKLLGDGK